MTDQPRNPALPELPHGLYALPAYVAENPTCQDLVELFNIIVVRLRYEVSQLTLNTLQQLLVERVALNYILLRYRERLATGEAGAYTNTKYEKEANTFWLASMRELNDQMRKASSDVERDAWLHQVHGVIMDTIGAIPDPGLKQQMTERFAQSFEAAGI